MQIATAAPEHTTARERKQNSMRVHVASSWLTLQCAQRKCKVKPIRASQSLSETFPCTGYMAFDIEGKDLRGNHVARIGI